MVSKHESSGSDHDGSARKRVCKACNRCRLKKSKCDGASPCGRCKSDDVVCTFGERKRVLDKNHPKGYVELLEQQQAQLVAGIRTMWDDIPAEHEWKWESLPNEGNGKIFVHDILERVGALKASQDYTSDQTFMEDPEAMQETLRKRSPFENIPPNSSGDSPYQRPSNHSRAISQSMSVDTPMDSVVTTHPNTPLGSQSPSTAESSTVPTPTFPNANPNADPSWLPTSTPCFSTDDSWLTSPFLFNTAPEAFEPDSPLKPQAFFTGEVDALLAGFDTSPI